MIDKVFQTHPAPWSLIEDSATCGNGSSLDTIEDANGETVATSYNSGFEELWSFYEILTDEQKASLGQGEFSISQFNNSMSLTENNCYKKYSIRYCKITNNWEASSEFQWGDGNTPYEALQKAKNS